jgi:hypothetical protein
VVADRLQALRLLFFRRAVARRDELGSRQGPGVSPRNLRSKGFADYVKDAHPKSKVLAISSKDRAAIGMSGQHPDLALWWDHGGKGFETSTWYAQALPQWVIDWNWNWPRMWSEGPFAGGWKCELPEHFEASGTAPDEREGEWGKAGDSTRSRTACPPLSDPPTEKELRAIAGAVYEGPGGDVFVLDLARVAVEKLELGLDDDPDVLAISLSSCDTVGHGYGPLSCEVTDVLLRADRELGKLFDELDTKVGADRWVASLSADHGVLELPESLADRGVAASRSAGATSSAIPQSRARQGRREVRQGLLLEAYSRGLRLSLSEMKEAKVDPAEVRSAYAAALKECGTAWLQHALTFDELKAIAREGAPASGLVRMEANSFDEERTCDVVLLCKPWMLIGLPIGTTHGTPYPTTATSRSRSSGRGSQVARLPRCRVDRHRADAAAPAAHHDHGGVRRARVVR